MKVGSIPFTPQYQPRAEASRKAGRAAAPEAAPGVRTDFSESSRQFKTLLEAAKASPDVRADKVAAIKQQIEAGVYKVDSRAVADKLLRQIPR